MSKPTPEFFHDQYGHIYVWRETMTGKRSEVILDASRSWATTEEKRMIVAAPKLLEALTLLKEAVEYTPLGERGIKAVAYANSIIAKARGES